MKFKSGIRKFFFVIGVMLLAAICGIVASIAAYRVRKQTVIYEIPDTASVGELRDRGTNILFLGTDRQAGLCDVMMLINVAFDDKRITVAHLPRDTYAKYTDKSYKKLNGAYNSLGGAEQVALFLSDAFDVNIEHFVCMGLDTLGAVVDAIGGVEVNIPEDMRYSDPEAGLYIDLKEGVAVLDGKKAEQFLRYRSGYADGDLGRIEAQKLFICSFFDKLVSEMSPVMAAKLCAAAEGIETDLSLTDWLEFGMKTLSLADGDINVLTLAGAVLTATQSGASYYCLSAPSNAEIMKKYFGSDGDFDRYSLFLNENYDEFEQVYENEIEYSVTSIVEIVGGSIKN